LDTDHNQQLSADELDAAEKQLQQRDFDDDLVITPRELILDPNAIAAATDPNSAERAVNQDDIPVLLVTAFTTPADIADGLVKHYDHNHDGRLTTSAPGIEISLPRQIMGQLDANGDGALDRDELLKFADRRADLELPFALGQVRAAQSRSRGQLPSTSEFRVRKTLFDGYEVKGGEVEIHFEKNNRDPQQTDTGNFRTVDRDNNGYIDLNEAQQNNITASAFAAMDVDGDGKVVKGEFTPYVDRQNTAAAVRLLLEVKDLGQNLFKMLDGDQDEVLSPRELRAAKDILAANDKNGDRALGGDEIPQEIHFRLVRGVGRIDTDVTVSRGAVRSTAQANSSGPLWFRKMDRNNDGDLSPQEFIGPSDAFQKLDANHDGLIDKDEAEAAGK
jgi:Ca2+-binding EF-hand superfamily protein